MTRFWRLWCEFFSLRPEKRILKGNRETASHRKTVLLLAMEHISYNETFDSMSGFKLYLKLKTERHLKLKIVRTSSQQNRYKGVMLYIKATPVLGVNCT